MDEGKLWSLIRNVLSQGGAIQLDRASMSGYEEYSARLDAAASDRVADFAQLSDAQIAELERECTQWRNELRIYRETENKRIAELEQSVTVRDAKLAQLQNELDLAQMDANLHKQIQRAAELLPDRCEIQLTVENGSGWVELFTGHAWVEPSPDGDLAEQVSECIDRALGIES